MCVRVCVCACVRVYFRGLSKKERGLTDGDNNYVGPPFHERWNPAITE